MLKYFLLLFSFLIISLNFISAQKITRGPYLQMVNTNSIIIRWRTDSMTNSKVLFGLNENNLDKNIQDKALSKEHVVQLNNLTANTQYFYKIGFDTVVFKGTQQYFSTAPLSNSLKKMRFAAYGDSGLGQQTQIDINKAFLHFWKNTRPDIMLLAGDNAYGSGLETEYQTKFFDIYQDSLLRNIPLYPVLGNHDYGNSEELAANKQAHYFNTFSTPSKGESGGVASNSSAYYSFNYGNVHFVILDTYGTENGKKLYDSTGTQALWLKDDLLKNNSMWTIALGHHPPYTKGTHNSDGEYDLVAIRKQVVPILERYGVDMAIFGHSHVYERSYLMKNHLDYDTTFSIKNKVSLSNATYNGVDTTCFYKLPLTKSPHGTVYVVAGSAGNAGTAYVTAEFPHRAAVASEKEKGGIFCFEVEDNRLDAYFVRADSIVKDRFTMMKNVGKRTVINQFVRQDTLELKASFIGQYKWSTGQKTRSIKVKTQEEGQFRYIVEDSLKCVKDTFDMNLLVSRLDERNLDFNLKSLQIEEKTLRFSIESDISQNLEMGIFDLLGRPVFNKKFSQFQSEMSISTPLSTGVFLLNIRNEKGQFLNRKVVVF